MLSVFPEFFIEASIFIELSLENFKKHHLFKSIWNISIVIMDIFHNFEEWKYSHQENLVK